ncbi:21728_t:CDS:2, partial [Racocetra persica]
LADKFEIGRKTVADILAQSLYWLGLDEEKNHLTITGLVLQEKAKQVAATLKIQNFAASDEAASAPIEKLPEFCLSLQNETSNYDLYQYRKLLLQKRIVTFDESNLTNQPPDPVTIYDTIQFVSQAWNKVSEDVIIHSWQKTDILSSTEINEFMDLESLVDLTNKEEMELENLIT